MDEWKQLSFNHFSWPCSFVVWKWGDLDTTYVKPSFHPGVYSEEGINQLDEGTVVQSISQLTSLSALVECQLSRPAQS